MKNTITLELKGIDFVNTRYTDNGNCAISKALKRQEGQQFPNTGTDSVFLYPDLAQTERVYYAFDYYGETEFGDDKDKAYHSGYGENVIRTIILTKRA